MPVIRIDDDVFKELQLRTNQENVFKETPNYVIRRALKIDPEGEGIHESTIYSEMKKYFETGDVKHLSEIRRRFITFGWIKPSIFTPEQEAAWRRRSDAAKRAVITKRKKYKTWPTRKRDHK